MRELKSEGLFIKKKEYAGKTIDVTIVGTSVSQLNDKNLVLRFQIGNESQEYMLELGSKQENFLIRAFGEDELKWSGYRFKMKFGELYPCVVNGKDVMGCEITFIRN